MAVVVDSSAVRSDVVERAGDDVAGLSCGEVGVLGAGEQPGSGAAGRSIWPPTMVGSVVRLANAVSRTTISGSQQHVVVHEQHVGVLGGRRGSVTS